MKTLNLKIQGGLNLKPNITIDGQKIHYKRNKFNNLELSHQTDKDSVEITISNILEIMGPCWWLVQMTFFIISLFGILNPKLEKFCYEINFKAKITLTDETNDVVLKFVQAKDGYQTIKTDSENIEIITNECKVNKKAKKRKKILTISKIFAWIALVIGIFLIIVL